ncbi:MAG: hypothetical protein ACD_2C00088G0013 [uncultured bacterium (gcode 4)]|uniref:Uncharacterized protein n=1 Tax=uncultured bacterium (gcode 4) TaxID=1234023 RepID=K2G3M3_9BACT|nr:MAG: hypothetical protein ACD_2C00088G0013 [uncultured bacterium (gcode 4)]
MKIRSRRKWSALIITIVVIMLVTIMMIYFLEKIVPISKNVKWIENSTIAYYEAQSWIEQWLLAMSWSNPALEATWGTLNVNQKYEYSLGSLTDKIPLEWEWNSDYSKIDLRWNKFWPGDPIQLVYNSNMQLDNLSIVVRVPNLDWDCSTHVWLDWTGSIMVNWSINWSWMTLNSASWITANQINTYAPATWLPWNWECSWAWAAFTFNGSGWTINIWNWIDLNWTPKSALAFYNGSLWANWSACNGWKCNIKFSVINNLKVSGKSIPYLEYRLTTSANPIPNQYATINSDWYSYWFKRHIRREMKQLTTNEALDFTVFQ